MKNLAIGGKYGVIFDMDGVISDTQNVHAHIESQVLGRAGVRLSPDEITSRFAGVGDEKMFADLFKEHGVTGISIPEARLEKWQLVNALMSSDGFKAIDYATELISTLKANGFRLAVGSGSPRNFIDLVIGELSLNSYFDCLISVEEVAHGKPAPDIFLKAADGMGVAPNHCVVIEDGVSGMQAAAKAGMGCIGLVPDKGESYPCSIKVTSLREISSNLILSIISKCAVC